VPINWVMESSSHSRGFKQHGEGIIRLLQTYKHAKTNQKDLLEYAKNYSYVTRNKKQETEQETRMV
jgi:hypothetical protein